MTKTIKKIIYLLLGLAAGGIVWFATESLMIMNGGSFYLHLIITGGFIGAVYGAVIGLGEGIALSIKSKAANGALFGLIFGFIAGAAAILIAQGLLFSATGAGSASINDIQTSYLPKARIPGWTVLGGILGIVEGVRTKSLRRLLFGLAGGLVGGLAGGLAYEGLNSLSIVAPSGLRLAGFIFMGIFIGAGLSIADAVGRYGVLKVVNGQFKGKEFIISRTSSLIGSADKADIVLPGDSALAAFHARVYRQSGSLHIEKKAADKKLYINDRAVDGDCQLKYEDVIRCGRTVLRFIP